MVVDGGGECIGFNVVFLGCRSTLTLTFIRKVCLTVLRHLLLKTGNLRNSRLLYWRLHYRMSALLETFYRLSAEAALDRHLLFYIQF